MSDKNPNTTTHASTIPDGWVETTLGEVCEIKGGKRLPKGENLVSFKTVHPYIRITDIENNQIKKNQLQFITDKVFQSISRYIVNTGDIIVSIVGSVGFVALIDEDLNNASLTENCVKFVNLKNLDSKFLYYFLISSDGQGEIAKNTVGAVQKKLPIYGVQNIQILLPPLPEQQAIASVLSAFDDKIELLREQNKTLELLGQTIFNEWFGKYGVDDELPEGWRVGKLGEEFDIIMGQSPNGESYNESRNGIIFFQGRAEFQERFPKIRLYTTEPKRIAEKFDVLVSVRAPVGDINVASDKCCIGRGLAAVRSNNKSYCLYKIKSLKESFDKFEAEGTVFGSINKDSFLNIQVVIAPKNTIEEFEKVASFIDQKIYENTEHLQSLTRTRDELLPRLMSGVVSVKIEV